MGCLSPRQKLDRIRKDCKREARRCDSEIDAAVREQWKLRMSLKALRAQQNTRAQQMGVAKSIVKCAITHATMLRIKDDLKDIELSLADAGAQIAMEDIMKQFSKTLESANRIITPKDMERIAVSLSMNSQKIKAKLAMSRDAMDQVKDGILDANEEAGLVDESAEADVTSLAKEMLQELDDIELDAAPRVVQDRRGAAKERLIQMDDEPKE